VTAQVLSLRIQRHFEQALEYFFVTFSDHLVHHPRTIHAAQILVYILAGFSLPQSSEIGQPLISTIQGLKIIGG